MPNEEYISLPQLAKILGISRIAVYRKVKNGQIKAVKIGRNYAVKKQYVENIVVTNLGSENKTLIERAVTKAVKEYGEVLKMLGRE